MSDRLAPDVEAFALGPVIRIEIGRANDAKYLGVLRDHNAADFSILTRRPAYGMARRRVAQGLLESRMRELWIGLQPLEFSGIAGKAPDGVADSGRGCV